MRRQQRAVLAVVALLLALLSPVARSDAGGAQLRVVGQQQDAAPLGRVTVRPVEHLVAAAPSLDATGPDGTVLAAGSGPQSGYGGTRPSPYRTVSGAPVRGPPSG